MLNKVAKIVKNNLESQVMLYSSNKDKDSLKAYSKSGLFEGPLKSYRLILQSLEDSIFGNFYRSMYNFHFHFDIKSLQFASISSKRKNFLAQTTPLTKIKLNLKAFRLETAFNTIQETIRKA